MANLELVVKESSNSHVTPQGQLCVLTWCAPLVFPASLSGMFPQVPGMLSGFVSPALCAWWCLLRSICPAMFAWFCMPGMYALHSAPGFGCPGLCAQYRASAIVCQVCMPGTRAQGFVPGVGAGIVCSVLCLSSFAGPVLWAWCVCPELYIPQHVPSVALHVWHGAPAIWTQHCVPGSVLPEFCFCRMCLALCACHCGLVSSVFFPQRLGLIWCVSQYVSGVCAWHCSPGILCTVMCQTAYVHFVCHCCVPSTVFLECVALCTWHITPAIRDWHECLKMCP